jgi:hypothetical protein
MFIPFVAHDGAGAPRVLMEWVASQTMFNRSQIVWTNLATVNKRRRSSDAIASSITRLAFERTFDFQRKLRTRADEWERLIFEDPTHTYDDERFLNLNAKVKDAFRIQGTRLWIIYKAHLLDAQAMEFILEGWKERDKAFGVILVGKLGHNQQRDEALGLQIGSLEDIKRYRSNTLELKRVEDEQEFYEKIIVDMVDDLKADFGSDLDNDSFCTQAWAYAQGHWDSTTMLATVLNDKLGTSRIITQAIAQEVFDFLMPKLDL